ncbi:MAG TPA: helix-turn-helix domain-containing protein [Patescibacteria group bacterium]|nr:helix-turn-helix domain-containing protein [Patescibacteria group bacterium]
MSRKLNPPGVGMTPSKTAFGSFVRRLRLERGMSQDLVAEKTGLAQTIVSMIEVGTRRYLNDHQLGQLAETLGCSKEDLRQYIPIKRTAQPKTDLGRLIRSRREEIGLSLSDFAQKMGMTPQKARALETKRNPGIHHALVRPLANALDLDSSVFFQFVKKGKRPDGELGRLVRERREKLGMTPDILAKKLGVTRQYVNYIELGKCCLSENDDLIARLAKILELDVKVLEAVRPKRRLKKKKNPTSLGDFLTDWRQGLSLTQEEVAKHLKISLSTVSSIERGRLRPSLNVLGRFATILDCQIPLEFFPTPVGHTGPKPRSKIERKTPLGTAVTTRRLELKISQAELARRAGVSIGVISGIERGAYHHKGKRVLRKIFKALEIEIPAEFVPEDLSPTSISITLRLSGNDLVNLQRIKELTGLRQHAEVVRRALAILRSELEKPELEK